MTIPFANPRAAYALRKQEIMEAVSRTFDSGQYILGPEVEAFEKVFAAYLGLGYAVSCANGTDALELALRGMGVGPGKVVFTVSHTAVATVAAIERAGGVPVLVDIDPVTYTINPVSLEETIRHLQTTRPELIPTAVIPVHLYGHPCDMGGILAIADKYDCLVLEDCAQAHGARYKGCMAGTMGKAAAFSFYPTKNLGALGDAGGVATNDAALAQEMAALRQYGWKERYISAEPGINSRLDPVQAVILAIQLGYLDADNNARKRIAETYGTELANCGLTLPVVAPWAEHVFHLYVALCPNRSTFMAFLKARGIGTAIHYPVPVHLQPAYKERILFTPGGLPVTEGIAASLVSLPMFPQLSDQDTERVCAAVREWAKAGA
jgi:dTDP-4-amino-4,6-dideoxygalactose transaminase